MRRFGGEPKEGSAPSKVRFYIASSRTIRRPGSSKLGGCHHAGGHRAQLGRRKARNVAGLNRTLPHEPVQAACSSHQAYSTNVPDHAEDIFDELETGDLVFIDSSHSVKVGSDVLRIYLDIIPNLSLGVFIQIHDIFLPYLYPRDALTSFSGWQETSLVLALLTNQNKLETLACISWLHYQCPEKLKEILPDYTPQGNHFGLEVGEGHSQAVYG